MENSVWQPGPRPAWVQSLHEVLEPGWIRLDADELLEEAMRRTGLSDFGGDAFLVPYRILVRALDEEAKLHALGRAISRSDCLNWLENRLQITETRKRHPEIAASPLDRPLFITGLPRTGTSILHELLAQDPGTRAPLHWEVRSPCPAPDEASLRSDPRIERAERQIQLWNQIVPEYGAMHELGARIPVECVQITAHEFVSEEILGRYQVPSYAAWYAQADVRPAYRFHRAMLQHLQWRCRRDRWVLKAPSHLPVLDALLDVYPDARIVLTHRDPLKILPSVASILYSTMWVRSDAIDADALLGWFTGETCLALIERAIALRESGRVDPNQFFDVRYEDLVKQPIPTIAGIYAHFGIDFSAEAERRMRAYLASKPKGKHGEHRYEFGQTGFDLAAERERFRAYRERYGVVSEA
jgi:sulfotransferase family protein